MNNDPSSTNHHPKPQQAYNAGLTVADFRLRWTNPLTRMNLLVSVFSANVDIPASISRRLNRGFFYHRTLMRGCWWRADTSARIATTMNNGVCLHLHQLGSRHGHRHPDSAKDCMRGPSGRVSIWWTQLAFLSEITGIKCAESVIDSILDRIHFRSSSWILFYTCGIRTASAYISGYLVFRRVMTNGDRLLILVCHAFPVLEIHKPLKVTYGKRDCVCSIMTKKTIGIGE